MVRQLDGAGLSPLLYPLGCLRVQQSVLKIQQRDWIVPGKLLSWILVLLLGPLRGRISQSLGPSTSFDLWHRV